MRSSAHRKAGAMWMNWLKVNNDRKNPPLFERGIFVRKTVRKIEDKTYFFSLFYLSYRKYFYHLKTHETVEI